MTDAQERREPGTQRVPVSTLVEVCGNIPGIPVFEAESVDVSARGMHLRTAYLPEDGAPLVCRFESEGNEIVVEGSVAWRREGSRGGEFGVKFTALDSRGVEALRGLCGADTGSANAAGREEDGVGEAGSRVRLHIDGLGSPMKARVRTGGASKVQVGSNLEFLKVGRRLEIEDLEQGARRVAHIDGVNVIIDPSSQVPQLIVALRYEGAEDTTPSPSISDIAADKPLPAHSLRIPAEAVTTREPEKPALPAEKTVEGEDEPEMRGRVAAMAASAESKAKAAGERLAHASSNAAKGAASFLKAATEKVRELAQKRAKAPRRTTSPAPSVDKPKLRPQSATGATDGGGKFLGARKRLTRRTLAVGAGVGLVAVTAFALAWRSPAAPPPGATAATSTTVAVVAAPGAPEAPAAPAAAPAMPPAAPGGGAVTANVPLFGPTPLTTTEPAPLGPAPGVEAEELAAAKASAKSASPDEAWAEEEEESSAPNAEKSSRLAATSEKASSRSASKPAQKPEDVSPWGRGKMHEPTIHRLRLDAPGAAIQGAVEPTGFTVVIPSRKVMEAATGIAKRDTRIARVRATNIGAGAQVSIRFKDGVPAYRVRLRRDYLEFLISAPVKEAKSAKPPEESNPRSSKSKHASSVKASRSSH